MVDRVLITGATGCLGRALAREWLAHTDHELVLWVHGDDRAARDAARARLAEVIGSADDRVRWAGGDLRDAAPFAGVELADLRWIVHAAARTEFTVSAADATAVNVEGAARVVELARRAPRLEGLALLSSVHAAGLRAGAIAEEFLRGLSGFANAYEASKLGLERLAEAAAKELPVLVPRVATVLADDDTGAVTARNAVHRTLELVHLGLLSIVPGRAGTPVYLETAARAARAIRRGLEARLRGVVHVSPGRGDTPTLGRLVEDVHAAFAEDPAWRARSPRPPLLCDEAAFETLRAQAAAFGGPILAQATRSVAPFAPQLFVTKDVSAARITALADVPPPENPRALVRRTARWLVAHRFGRGRIASDRRSA